MDTQEIESMIEDCENRSEKLSEWELTFIDDISRQFDKSGSLSEKQLDKLETIWEKVT